MSRKLILALATVAAIAASASASTTADARGFGGGGGGGGGGFGHFAGVGRVGGGGGGVGRIGGIGRISGFGHFSGVRRVAGGPFPILLPPGKNGPHIPWWHHHHHWHWWFHDGRWAFVDDAVAEPVVGPYAAPVVSTPGPCTCLTESYTQDGMVVFADLCTKESAAAPVDGRAADATPVPPETPSTPPAPPVEGKASEAAPMQNTSNFAGRTYKDFLAANGLPIPQSAQGN
jgi:hypothetical protein